jgi:hypothetical protein
MRSGQPNRHGLDRNLDARQNLRHPFREIARRGGDAALVADTVIRTAVKAWDLISPAEFSVLYRLIRRQTMCSNARLRALYRATKYVIQHDT